MNAPHPRPEALYLAQLGERVRAWRADQGMTRRRLAAVSGVSERYLAQLEAGRGNVSILLLRRIARAMEVPVEFLVRERDGSARHARVALVGVRGAGKSTLGEKLARSLGVPFVELDREVEREAGAALADVFAIYGQEGFRRFERQALARVLKELPRAVIAAGGGIVNDPETWRILREHCFCVWLKASAEEHMKRVMDQGDLRPFRGRTAALDEIRRLLAEREPLYACADAAIDTSGRPVQASLAELRALLAKELT
ncbi:MAG: helix-turn-helix transcriptional regulator [Burkholderiales bacterium]|nr:helix-turn-helix transcriptional regulator [Burkholderiales bacterium]